MGECKEKEQGEEEEGGRGKQAGHLSLDSEKGRCPGSGRIHQKRKVQDSSASHMNSIVIRRNVSKIMKEVARGVTYSQFGWESGDQKLDYISGFDSSN
jgi:hypothetical protein